MKRLLTAGTLSLILLGACATTSPKSLEDTATTPDTTLTHGAIDGAQELSQAAHGLVTVTSDGTVRLIDVATESTSDIATGTPIVSSSSDGRFVALNHPDHSITLVDSGVWTWDHGDHQHYYRAPARHLGTLPLAGTAQLGGSSSRLAVAADTEVALFDREELGRGNVTPIGTYPIDAHTWAAPIGSTVAIIRDGFVTVIDEAGAPTSTPPRACPQPVGGLVTRAGIIFACQGGVVHLVEDSDGTVTSQWLPLPAEATTETIHSLGNRLRRPTVAVTTTSGAVWVLNVRQGTWNALPAPTAMKYATAMDDTHDRVVARDAQGQLYVWADGVLTTTTQALASPTSPIYSSANRVYIRTDAMTVLEIDAADSARIARTLPTPDVVAFHEVGL
ncbi:hypothetical protein [Schaalia suimastitidis]|uniref:hypothetical protein n=1 Tax=Schaalia suimastitidis TaxID=121163 RepID=UPI0004032B20|nr:hypothetical protein [Schaalia suimastitidis]